MRGLLLLLFPLFLIHASAFLSPPLKPRGSTVMMAKSLGISSRSQQLEKLMASGLLYGIFTVPRRSNAAEEEAVNFLSPNGDYSFRYPSSFKTFTKPLKTHLEEINIKSESVKGFTAGVAVDPLKISNIRKAGSPEDVGKRIVAVEAKKEGVFNVNLVSTSSISEDDLEYYLFDYIVESSRGFNHYLAKAAVQNNKLFVFTAQIKEQDLKDYESVIRGLVSTFRVLSSK